MIKDLFLQDVNREIETVVKADDRRNIDNEIREYVITNEISRKIGSLFSSYGHAGTINGVWIHGFFGSGKSHLLKMLSFVFGGHKLSDGSLAADVFAGKTDDSFIKADINRVSRIPSESVLFNIDQQATISNNENRNSVLMVFYKVFFDHLGFYGTQPHMAEFEWWLRFRKNIYEEFKEEFGRISGKDWTEARRDYYDPDVTEAGTEALKALLNSEESDFETILENIEKRQNLSVGDFANRVAEYIKTKPANFHLNFFVDEVGQFVAGDVNLMLNLQTITESLATASNNKSWVFATAQSAIEGLGEYLKHTQDYARILGRFKVQINLTSANVDEVIEKRLLEKREEKIPLLLDFYKKEESLIKTIISSADGGMPIIAYKDENDFILKYPFLFYQFSLFQECRISLAEHDVFQGKHASVGERNMLGVFQTVLKEIENNEIHTVASFDKMYKGIENDLRAEFVSSINNAQSNIHDHFAVKVLKTLFLVKYYKQFQATRENIAMLLIDNIHIDIKAHQEKVNRALNLLEHHSYIERNGERYEFLTNKEKDIETEIKNTRIEESKINQMLKELFFDEVLGRSRIRFNDNKQEFEYTQKLDGGIFGREKELAVEIISPNNPTVNDIDALKIQTMGMPLLRLVMKPDKEFIDDVRMSLKIERYNAINQAETNSSETRSIINQKLSDNNRRKNSLRNRADQMLGRAKAFVDGEQLDVLPRSSGKDHVESCFQQLIKKTYPNLRMLGNVNYTEDTFKHIIDGFSVAELFEPGDPSLSEAEMQIINLVDRRKANNERSSVYDLKTHFAKRPFGWHENATFTVLAKLYKKNKIEVVIVENPLDNNGLKDALLNSTQHSRAYVIGQTVYSSQQIRDIKELYRDLFDTNTTNNDAKDIGNDFKEKLREFKSDVGNLLAQSSEYPFVIALQDFYDNLSQWTNRNYKDIIENVRQLQDLLLDAKEDDYDPIKSFINGQQGSVYKNIAKTVTGNTANIAFVEGDEFSRLEDFLKLPKPYLGNALREAETLRSALVEKVKKLIEDEKLITQQAYTEELEMLKDHPEIKKLSEAGREKLVEPIEKKLADIKRQNFIGNIRSARTELPKLTEQVLNKAVEINISTTSPITPYPGGDTVKPDNWKEPVHVTYINKDNVLIPFDKNELATEDEVREYVKLLEEIYLKEIQQNKRIRL
ncbi:MAG: BREX system P-loop protein BrxC [Bacteroidales bacterium]|jgi:hypothetical protein|nr:BREX system P-loop protein BrxC [Bacteroidales bacterium]